MEPASDSEWIIARAVDEMFWKDPDNCHHSVQRDYLDVAMALDFTMSASDSQFLINYIHRRLIHPISPWRA